MQVLFGSQDGWLNVMDNIGSFVERFAEGGFIGLVALALLTFELLKVSLYSNIKNLRVGFFIFHFCICF